MLDEEHHSYPRLKNSCPREQEVRFLRDHLLKLARLPCGRTFSLSPLMFSALPEPTSSVLFAANLSAAPSTAESPAAADSPAIWTLAMSSVAVCSPPLPPPTVPSLLAANLIVAPNIDQTSSTSVETPPTLTCTEILLEPEHFLLDFVCRHRFCHDH